jgi:multidrug efflux pump
MLGVTLFGLFLTPVFYVTLRKFVTRGKVERKCCPRRGVADNKKPLSL